ncbi:MAG: hypothetical protein QXO63_01570 [Thermoplasmatales archaeon]
MERKNRKDNFVRLGVLLLLLLIPSPHVFADTKVVTKDYRLSLKADNLPLTEIAKLLNSLGIDVFIDVAEKDRAINVEIRDVPFEKAIKMLAYPLNYAIIFDEAGGIKEVRIFRTSLFPANGYAVFKSADREKTKDGKHVSVTSDGSMALLSSARDELRKIIDKRKNAENSLQEDEKFITHQGALGGETAYAYNVWLNKRLAEMNNISEQGRIYAEKEMNAMKSNMAQNLNLLAKATMEPTTPGQLEGQWRSQDASEQDMKNAGAFYNYSNEYQRIMEVKRTKEISEVQKKNLASYVYYRQKSRAGTLANPHASYESYHQVMNMLKIIYGKR